jgi:hypothetical protein
VGGGALDPGQGPQLGDDLAQGVAQVGVERQHRLDRGAVLGRDRRGGLAVQGAGPVGDRDGVVDPRGHLGERRLVEGAVLALPEQDHRQGALGPEPRLQLGDARGLRAVGQERGGVVLRHVGELAAEPSERTGQTEPEQGDHRRQQPAEYRGAAGHRVPRGR